MTERIGATLNLIPAAVHDAFPAVLFGRVLVLATRFGIFELLDRVPGTPSDVCRELAIPETSASLLLSSLHAGGYLTRRGPKFGLAAQSRKWLVRRSPFYLGNFLRYLEMLHGHWMLLEESLRKGTAAADYPRSFTPEEWRIYTDGMRDLASLILPRVLKFLTLPAGAGSILDVGGSHALYAAELCRLHPGLSATVADLPQVLERTREIVDANGLSERITLLPCDLNTVSFGAARHDAVLMFNIAHGFSPGGNRSLISRIAGALKPGGILYILDQFRRERSSGADRLLPLMVGVNLLNEMGGTAYEEDAVRGWCAEAGLGRITARRLSLPGVGLLRAVKIGSSA